MKRKGIFISLGVLLVIAAVVVVLLTRKTPIKTYTVTFNTDGGTAIETQYVKGGGLAKEPLHPLKEGCYFLFWFYDNKEFDFDTPITEDITLLAKYNRNLYLIEFENHETYSIWDQKVRYGDVVEKPNDPTKPGCDFLFWSYQGEEYDFSKPVTNNLKLIAEWETIKYYIKFDCDNGDNIIVQQVQKGKCATIVETPTKPGYVFSHWEYNGNKFYFSNKINDNMTIVAKWKLDTSKNTEGLKYRIDEEKETCSVIGYNGVAEGVTIGKYYQGYLITGIEDSAFKELSILKEIYISDNVTDIGKDAFLGCKNLVSVRLPEVVAVFENNAFAGCINLKNITMPKYIGYIKDRVFAGCDSLESIVFPETVNYLGESVFLNCDKLTIVELPDTLTEIPANTFSGCTNLASVNIPNNIKRIGEYAFENCNNLKYIFLPNSITYIGKNAFSNCTSLKSIIIPESVVIMNEWVFVGCTNLSIKCEASYLPGSWKLTWNISNCPVEWNYKN